MPPVPTFAIDDATDSRLAEYQNVSDPDLARRRGVFVAEGRLVVSRLLTATALPVRSLMVTAPALESLRPDLHVRPEVPVYLVPPATMNVVAGFNIHRGCLAIGERPAPRDWRVLAASGRRAVALERLGDADNVGSVFRGAAALGAAFVLLGPGCADPLYRKAIRTSMGAVLSLPYAHAEPWPAALTVLREEGWAVVGTTPSRQARPVREVAHDVAQRPVLVVVGHEGTGLTAEALAACEHLARIPITDRVDSLNVATAAAIALYEMQRDTDR